jgi:hypothetical protein
MARREWTPELQAELLARAERGLEPHELGPPVPNPLRKAGRPSLSPAGGTSKALNTRIPAELHAELTALAAARGQSVSDLVRAALDALVEDYRDAS